MVSEQSLACDVFSVKRLMGDKRDELGCDAILSCMKNRAYGELGDIRLDFHPRSRRFVQSGQAEKMFGWNMGFVEIDDGEEPPF